MTEPTEIKLDLREVRNILNTLEDAVFNLEDHEGVITVYPQGGRDARNDPGKAEASRLLLHAAEVAGLLRAELHVRYWALKGHPDPRGSDR